MLPYLWKSLRSILIAPGYEVYSQMGIYQRDLSSFDEYSIIDNSETYGMCVNCHTSNRTNPNQFVFHVRGDHGATMIQQSDRREWLKAQNETLGGSMVYPYWHPSEQYCAFSTNQTRQGFHITDQKRIEVFDLSSDVFVYHPATHEIISDSLLSTKDWSENCPVFSPDGKKLYFITCIQQSYPMHYKDEQYNLCCFDNLSAYREIASDIRTETKVKTHIIKPWKTIPNKY